MAVKCILTGQTPSVLDGVTENVQTQLDGKESKINLTANRAVVVGSDGKLAVSAVTSTELGYLDGVTSNIQTQLNSKLSSAPVTSVAGKTGAVTLAKGDVGLGNVDNTSDANKPISTATQTALDGKQDKITASGLLSGDGAGGVTAAEETEVELVEITPDSIGAASKAYVDSKLGGTTLSVTLSSASWTGDSAPYAYTVSNSAITATSTQELTPATDITADQLTALQNANIIDGGQAVGSMTLKAFGEKPSVDIPVRIIVKG